MLRKFLSCFPSIVFLHASFAFAQAQEVIVLPSPDKSGGAPLMEALAKRHATSDFSEKEITKEMMSNLLWASWGVNLPNKRRVSPTAHNPQKVNLYVVLPTGGI